jgi:phosphatidylinositol alpha-mannosyltransferase
LRVALHCPYSLSVPGGAQGQVLGLARELGKLGHEATILAPLDAPSGHEYVIGLGRSLPVRANGSIAPVALGPTASLRALRAVREGQFDVVHLHEPLAPGASYALLMLSGRPMAGTFHRSGGSVLYTLLRPAARALADRLEVRCAVSEAARDTAKKALGGSYEIVGNGVDVERFCEAEPWPTEGPTVMFVGRHEQRKGLAILLEAFSCVDNPRAVCWIAGQGPETARLKEAYPASRSFVWLGPIDDTELARRLRGAQVACFPSLGGESFGVVLLEAMAAGSAIVASDLPGYRSVADRHALFVRPGDVEDLASGLRTLLADAERGEGMSSPAAVRSGRAHAESFSMATVADRYVSIYEEAIGRSGRH